VDAGDVDHHPRRAGVQEPADRLAGAQERAPQVDGEDLVEVGAGQLVRRPGALDAGVVDQHVQPAEPGGRLPDHADDVVLVGDVPLDEQVADALLPDPADTVADLLLGAGGLPRVAQVVDGDVGAVFGEAHGDRLADAGAAAGDEHVLVLESSHGWTPRLVGLSRRPAGGARPR
jgi:hypothetical protein